MMSLEHGKDRSTRASNQAIMDYYYILFSSEKAIMEKI